MDLVFVNIPSKLNNMTLDSEKARLLAAEYKRYFEKPTLTKDELQKAKKVLQQYIIETKYKIND